MNRIHRRATDGVEAPPSTETTMWRVPAEIARRNHLRLTTKIGGVFAPYLVTVKRRRCHGRALNDALAAFESSHRRWVESCFDLPFLRGHGAEALEAGDPQALARAWTLQFRFRDETQRDGDVRRLMPAAETFLALLQRSRAACGEDRPSKET